MAHPMKWNRPLTFEPGKIYLRRTGRLPDTQSLPVRFVAYSACPEIVIIENGSGRERCPRWELYLFL